MAKLLDLLHQDLRYKGGVKRLLEKQYRREPTEELRRRLLDVSNSIDELHQHIMVATPSHH